MRSSYFHRISSPPIRRLTVLLDHLSAGDSDEYRWEIESYQNDLDEAFRVVGFNEIEFITDHTDLPTRIHSRRPEFVLHLAEYGLKGSRSLYCCQIPALLEQVSVPFSNAGPRGMVFSSDKHFLNEVLKAAGLPVPEEVLLHRDDILNNRFVIPESFRFPGFLKTRLNGGSVGISGSANIIAGREALPGNLRKVLSRFSADDLRGENMDEWLLQEFLPGPEFSVAIVGNGSSRDVLPIGQLEAFVPFLTYTNSAEVPINRQGAGNGANRYAPADLSPEELSNLRDYALAAYEHLACRDYARFDFRRDRVGVVKLIDGNSLPGVYKGSAFVAMAAMRNQSFADLWYEILGVCFDRCFTGRENGQVGI
jgi:D-alanine-D-alanine ligase